AVISSSRVRLRFLSGIFLSMGVDVVTAF
ncbi:hypothetical protein A2U01_0109920, partial [Trifolium medium]|nr:hypothetical protein [Trifolium medium]